MEAYVRVKKERSDEEIKENEVRITAVNKVRNYISYALSLLEEKGHSSVALKAMGQAINKAVVVAEILKRRVVGLHQTSEISSLTIVDVWEPKEEGLDRLETTRRVSAITITLSREPLDETHIGYQAPLPEDQVKPLDPDELELGSRPRRPRGRGRGRHGGDGEGEGDTHGDGAEGAAGADGEHSGGGDGDGAGDGDGDAAAGDAAGGAVRAAVRETQGTMPGARGRRAARGPAGRGATGGADGAAAAVMGKAEAPAVMAAVSMQQHRLQLLLLSEVRPPPRIAAAAAAPQPQQHVKWFVASG